MVSVWLFWLWQLGQTSSLPVTGLVVASLFLWKESVMMPMRKLWKGINKWKFIKVLSIVANTLIQIKCPLNLAAKISHHLTTNRIMEAERMVWFPVKASKSGPSYRLFKPELNWSVLGEHSHANATYRCCRLQPTQRVTFGTHHIIIHVSMPQWVALMLD